MVEAQIEIETGEGAMGSFVVHPDAGGPLPVVLFLMDAPGKRPLLHAMARRLAGHGYYVMLPNLYYRTTPAFELDFTSKVSFARMSELMRGVGNKMVSRDAAALFFYGVRLHTEAPDSPHQRLGEISGELYVGCAEHDDYVPLEMVDRLEAAMKEARVRGRLERYWGAHHGFAFNDRPAYAADADARHWRALLDLFARNLQPSMTTLGFLKERP